MLTSSRGFTLIELLVVIAIIGLLASVVLASLSTARLRAQDAAVQSEAEQLRTVLNEQYDDVGSYAGIKSGSVDGDPGWIGGGDICYPQYFSGSYTSTAAGVCTALAADTGKTCGATCVFFLSTNPDSPNKFTILAYLPGASALAKASRYLCMGSSGASSVDPGTWNSSGCYNNP